MSEIEKKQLIMKIEESFSQIKKPPCKTCGKELINEEGVTLFHNDREVTHYCSKCHRKGKK